MLKIVTKPPPPRWAGAFLGYFNPVQFLTLAGPVTWKYSTRGQRMGASQIGGNRIKRGDKSTFSFNIQMNHSLNES